MKRLGQILVDAVAILSVILCVAATCLWVRSRYVSDTFRYQYADFADLRHHTLGAMQQNGYVRLSITTWTTDTQYGFQRLVRDRRLYLGLTHYDEPTDGQSRPMKYEGRFGFQSGTRRWMQPAPLAWIVGPPYRRDLGNLYAIEYTLCFPHAFIVALLTIMPATWYFQRWQRRRTASAVLGRCPTCGYDLRATPDRCPECGSPSDDRIAAKCDVRDSASTLPSKTET